MGITDNRIHVLFLKSGGWIIKIVDKWVMSLGQILFFSNSETPSLIVTTQPPLTCWGGSAATLYLLGDCVAISLLCF